MSPQPQLLSQRPQVNVAEELSVPDICRQTGISKTTIYKWAESMFPTPQIVRKSKANFIPTKVYPKDVADYCLYLQKECSEDRRWQDAHHYNMWVVTKGKPQREPDEAAHFRAV